MSSRSSRGHSPRFQKEKKENARREEAGLGHSFSPERDVTSFNSSSMWTRELIGLRDRFQSRKCTVVQNTDRRGKGFDISFFLLSLFPSSGPSEIHCL